MRSGTIALTGPELAGKLRRAANRSRASRLRSWDERSDKSKDASTESAAPMSRKAREKLQQFPNDEEALLASDPKRKAKAGKS